MIASTRAPATKRVSRRSGRICRSRIEKAVETTTRARLIGNRIPRKSNTGRVMLLVGPCCPPPGDPGPPAVRSRKQPSRFKFDAANAACENHGNADQKTEQQGHHRCTPPSHHPSSAEIPKSLSCSFGTGIGASVSGHAPVDVFGNAMTSRSDVSPAIIMTKRSIPRAKPP